MRRFISAPDRETDHSEIRRRRGATRPGSGGGQAPGQFSCHAVFSLFLPCTHDWEKPVICSVCGQLDDFGGKCKLMLQTPYSSRTKVRSHSFRRCVATAPPQLPCPRASRPATMSPELRVAGTGVCPRNWRRAMAPASPPC